MIVRFKVQDLLKEDAETDLQGWVDVEVPPHHERLLFATKIGLSDYSPLDEKGGEDQVARMKNLQMQIEIAAKASKIACDAVKGCEVFRQLQGPMVAEAQVVANSPEVLAAHPDCTPIIEGLAERFMTNFATRKTKPLSKPS